MRLRVDGGGYADAASAFETGNHVAALVHDSLAGKLTAYAGMAGHDDSSATFAAAYDDAAADAVGALSDLVAAFGALGHLTTASLANHRDANVASIVGGAHVYEGGALPEDAYASVLAADPPSALGVENTPVLPYPLGLLVEALDGFVWPSADVDRLRDAAHTWRSTAESLDGLTDYCRGAVRGLEPQESPEIPIAIDAIRDLERTIDDLADAYLSLAAACEEYAATVDAKRAELVALGHEVLRMIAEEAAISAGLGLLTGGVGGLLKGGAGFARIARHAPRFAAILIALRAAATATAETLRSTGPAVRGVRDRLARFARATPQRWAARGEGGHLSLIVSRKYPLGFLNSHEHSGTHVIARHAAQNYDELYARFSANRPPPFSSTFPDQATAERFIGSLLEHREDEVLAWVGRGHPPRLRMVDTFDRVTGVSMDPTGRVVDVTGIRILLVPDEKMPEGFRLLTGFPQP